MRCIFKTQPFSCDRLTLSLQRAATLEAELRSLNLGTGSAAHWTYFGKRCSTVSTAVPLYRDRSFAGGTEACLSKRSRIRFSRIAGNRAPPVSRDRRTKQIL